MIVVSNTSPINYLILIDHINLLPELFQQITIPQAVYSELSDASAPAPVQIWIATPPDWLKIQSVNQPSDAIVDLLDPGEREAILLAQELNANLLLLELINLPFAIQNLQKTSFWVSDSLLQRLLDKHV